MRSDTVRYVLALIALVVASALEELFPKVLSVGFPFLMGATVYYAVRAPSILCMLFALAAGGAEDSLSSLPFLTGPSFFILIAALIRITQLPYVVAPLAFPIFQLWLNIWIPDLDGSIFIRGLLALPLGAASIGAAAYLLDRSERRAAADEVD